MALCLVLARPDLSVSAQASPRCTSPQSISADIAPFSAFTQLARDPYGVLHLIWSSGVEPGRNEEQVETDTIYYTTNISGSWAEPVDILADTVYASAEDMVVLDDALWVLWRTRDRLYLSRAPLAEAAAVKSWSTQELAVGSITDADLFASAESVLHVGYTYNEAMLGEGYIGYMWSDDGGIFWERHAGLSPVDAQNFANTQVQVFADRGAVQVAWSQIARDNRGMPVNVWYARSEDRGATWTELEEVFAGPGASYPSFSLGGAGQLYMTWIRSVGYGDSKYIRTSTDNGLTWSEPQLLFSEYRGLNGRITILLDSASIEHLIMGGDVRNVGTTAIWYSQRTLTGWITPIPLSTGLLDSEFAEAVIIHGNQLHIVWNDFIEDDIFYVTCALNAPAVAPGILLSPTPTVLPVLPPESVVDSAVSESPELPIASVASEPSVQTSQSPLMPLLLGVTPVLLLVGFVLMRRQYHAH